MTSDTLKAIQKKVKRLTLDDLKEGLETAQKQRELWKWKMEFEEEVIRTYVLELANRGEEQVIKETMKKKGKKGGRKGGGC